MACVRHAMHSNQLSQSQTLRRESEERTHDGLLLLSGLSNEYAQCRVASPPANRTKGRVDLLLLLLSTAAILHWSRCVFGSKQSRAAGLTDATMPTGHKSMGALPIQADDAKREPFVLVRTSCCGWRYRWRRHRRRRWCQHSCCCWRHIQSCRRYCILSRQCDLAIWQQTMRSGPAHSLPVWRAIVAGFTSRTGSSSSSSLFFALVLLCLQHARQAAIQAGDHARPNCERARCG